MTSPALFDENVTDRIKPVTRALLAGVPDWVKGVDLHVGPEPERAVRIALTDPAEYGAPEPWPELSAAVADLIAAWDAVAPPAPALRFACSRTEDGWKTSLALE